MYLNTNEAYCNKLLELARTKSSYFVYEENELKPGRVDYVSKFTDLSYLFPITESSMSNYVVRLVMEGSTRGYLENKSTAVALKALFNKFHECGYFLNPAPSNSMNWSFFGGDQSEDNTQTAVFSQPVFVLPPKCQPAFVPPRRQPEPRPVVVPCAPEIKLEVPYHLREEHRICEEIRKNLNKGKLEECQILVFDALQIAPESKEVKRLNCEVVTAFAEQLAATGDVTMAYQQLTQLINYGRGIATEETIRRLADLVIKHGVHDNKQDRLLNWLIDQLDPVQDGLRISKLKLWW